MGRLFWKLFFAFWVAFVVIIVGVVIGSQFYRAHVERELFENSSVVEAQAIANLLREEGEQAALQLMRDMRISHRRIHVAIVDEQGANLTGKPLPRHLQRLVKKALKQPMWFPQREVVAPSGKRYHVISLGRRDLKPLNPHKQLHGIPTMTLLLTGIVSLLLCFLLARYLSRPIKKLSNASKTFARGELNTRVAPAMGKRRDEIADLASDFDQMATQLQSLIGGQQQLLRDISHELRSPLARLQMAVGLARKRNENNDTSSELSSNELDRIERDVQRLEQLVSQVLTLSRLETNISDTRTDLVDITTLMATIVDDVRFEADTHQRQLQFEATIEPSLMADGELLRQAFENIIRNAIKYTDVDTTVTVIMSRWQQGFAIEVCDHGPGVPQAMLAALFEPFVRTSDARERDSGGHGLGLAIAKRAIEYHGGTVTARNRDSGGLCIRAEFPSESTDT